jgi:formylmethanofuran dehydrogenase subunit E
MRWILIAAASAVLAAAGQTDSTPDQGDHAMHVSKPGERAFHVLKDLPMNPEAYHHEAAELVEKGIPEKYGHEEWAAVVITHELHQHVGIMTVVGAKMAVRARELLEAPPRAVKVVTETGPEPPFACAVDGIQAGLASTYAQQLIDAPPVKKPRLAATFTYGGRTLRLVLRPEYQTKISGCIRSSIKKYGNLTPAYFEAIEVYCYEVWAEFDRHDIFTEDFVKSLGK